MVSLSQRRGRNPAWLEPKASPTIELIYFIICPSSQLDAPSFGLVVAVVSSPSCCAGGGGVAPGGGLALAVTPQVRKYLAHSAEYATSALVFVSIRHFE